MREQVELLEHHAHATALPLDVGVGERPHAVTMAFVAEQLAVEVHRAAVDRLELVDAAHEGGLARARGSEHRDDLLRVHLEVDAVEGDVVAELLAHPDDLRARGSRSSCRRSCHRLRPLDDAAGDGGLRHAPAEVPLHARCTSVRAVTTTRYQITATISIGTTSYVRL